MAHTPDGFPWGTATAADQVEGAHDAGGRTPAIRDTFPHRLGRIGNGNTGDARPVAAGSGAGREPPRKRRPPGG